MKHEKRMSLTIFLVGLLHQTSAVSLHSVQTSDETAELFDPVTFLAQLQQQIGEQQGLLSHLSQEESQKKHAVHERTV